MKRVKGAIASVGKPIALALAAVGTYRLARIVSIGAAYKSKTLCSGIFVARREASSILQRDLSADKFGILRHIKTTVDFNAGEVTASLLGIRRKSRFTPGFGSTICYNHFPACNTSAVSPSASPPRQEQEKAEYNPRLEGALEWAFSEPAATKVRRTRAVVVVHEGKIVAERYAAGFNMDTPLAGWSMTKGVMNALVGIMVRMGKTRLDAPIAAPEWLRPGDRRSRISLEHLLHMSSGLRFNEDYGHPLQDVTTMLFSVPDAAHFAAEKPLVAEPGTRLSYSSGSTNIISRNMRHVLGDEQYWSFPKRELFDRIGMTSAVMERDASGTFVGSSFMYATARDWSRFGQLYLQDGIWEGERILPEGWVEFSRRPAPLATENQYGAHFWLKIGQDFSSGDRDIELPEDTFHATGYEGQFLTIIPSRRLVIVRLGLTTQPGAWQHDRFVDLILNSLQ